MKGSFSLPTILVADQDDAVRNPLVRDLSHEGYFVLPAKDEIDALEIVRVHSRPIHLLLTDESMNGRTLAATLQQYRPKMHALFITRYPQGIAPDVIPVESAVAGVREFLKLVDSPEEPKELTLPAQRFKVSRHVA